MSLNDVDGRHPASAFPPPYELVVTIRRTEKDINPAIAYRKVILPLTRAQDAALRCDEGEEVMMARAYLREPERT